MTQKTIIEDELEFLENQIDIVMNADEIEDFFGTKKYVHIPIFFYTTGGILSKAVNVVSRKNWTAINNLHFVVDRNGTVSAYVYDRQQKQRKSVRSPSDVFFDYFDRD